MEVSTLVNGGIVMDVSVKVRRWHCDGRIDEGRMVAL